MRYVFIAGWALLGTLILWGCSAKQPSPTQEDTEPTQAYVVASEAYASGDRTRSIAMYRALVESHPSNPVYRNNLGVLQLEAGNAADALESFESASLQAPNEPLYLVNTGLAQIGTGNQDEALIFFDRALQFAPDNTRAIYGKGVAYLALNEPEIALGFFRQAVDLDPTDGPALFMMAYASQKNDLWDDAIRQYTSYLAHGTDKTQRANALSNRGLCRFELGDLDGGMADLDAAMKLDDNNAIFYYNRAQGHQLRSDFEAAVMDYTRAISRKSAFPEAYINRGELRYILDMKPKACADLKRACDLGFCGPLETYRAADKCPE